ncbi:MAG TPA: thiolase domain-containing protein [Thermoplasmata archaeon]|nr:thiolase domain-containing protein [Thermoplasmata archaeon]
MGTIGWRDKNIRGPRALSGRRAAVVGAGHTRFGVLPEGPRALLRSSVDAAFKSVDRGMERRAVQEGFVGTLGFSGWQLGNVSAVLAEEAGLAGIPMTRVENACASAGFALQAGVRAIESGARDAVLIAGVEKMTDVPSARRRYWLGVSGDTEWERLAGLTFAGVYGLLASRHMAEHGTPPEALAEVAVKNHAHGLHNPNAQFRKAVSRDDVLRSPRVATPLGLLDCCPVSDGAAALLLVDAESAHRYTDTPVYVAGVGAGSDWLAVQERDSLTQLAATRRAAEDAFRAAGVERRQISFLEVHDCFTIAEILALEDLGFAPPGGAAAMTLAGETRLGGRLPVNPDGGLKAKGHPIGATGASQAYEAFLQLRGAAGQRQVAGAEKALTHNVGGSGASAVVTIFSRSLP